MYRVLVFRTSVRKRGRVRYLAPYLNNLINGHGRWNFDLEDCDNILRVETQNPDAVDISGLLQKHGFLCEELH
ncbi:MULTISPECIES: hypothetical protein [Maribacter]|uniref:Uncharacterized protein n=1 Tax=Maribacter flavus TaxID=1658664 RepID=A0ABU7IE43_9FLAO|nr:MULTISPECIES: hypothetical protein [Maribacter]MDC6404074.1 hypothetical protein [Maribacter sp. PR66]MEE1971215.1 hypothetical protein [Maribacter flavus]